MWLRLSQTNLALNCQLPCLGSTLVQKHTELYGALLEDDEYESLRLFFTVIISIIIVIIILTIIIIIVTVIVMIFIIIIVIISFDTKTNYQYSSMASDEHR